MDQVKVALAVLKKYHFWLLTVVVLGVGIAVWFMATNSRAALFKENLAKIESADNSLGSAMGENPPNAQFKEKVDKLHEGLKQEVAGVWKELYDKQVELFVWPDLVANTIAKLGPDEQIPDRIRAYYNDNVVRDEWKRVFDLANIRRIKGEEEDLSGGGGDMMGGGPGMMAGPVMIGGPDGGRGPEVEMEGIVYWDKSRRAEIIGRYYSEKAPPTDLKVRMTQEDLWIFEFALVDVVEQVNANARDSLGATIKQIQVLDLAQWAINAANESGGKLWTPGQEGGGGGMMMPGMEEGGGMPGGPEGMPGGGDAMPGGEGAMAGGGGGGGAPDAAAAAASADTALLDGRYLDDQGKPMKGDGTGPYAEFKQMFVYMRFLMDQRKLPDLLAACANAPLPIETRQVRVHIGDQDKAATGAGGGNMDMMMPGMGGDAGGGMGMPEMMGGGGGGNVETGPYDAVVELSGIIYLYNPPDIEKLGTGSSSDPSQRSFSIPTEKVAVPNKSSSGMGYGMPGGN